MSTGFDFTAHMRRLCVDIVERLGDFAHIDMSRVAIRTCQVRQPGRFGMQASLTPLRFAGGAIETTRRRRRYAIERVFDPSSGREMLYLLSFYLPRFLDYPFEEKLATVCHELWHIGPEFDGDLRRHAGRCYAHGHSAREYHDGMRQFASTWLALDPPVELYDFLHCNFRELRQRFGAVYGTKIPTPKLIAVASKAR